MAKVKLQLTANPTFKAQVPIPVPGGKPIDVEFTFKHRNKEQLKDFLDELDAKGKEDIDLVMDIACGWELEDSFDKENVAKMISEYVGSALAVLNTYINESTGLSHRTKK